MYASLGFKIDSSNLDRFQLKLREVQKQLTAFGNRATATSNKIQTLTSRFSSLRSAINSGFSSSGRNSFSGSLNTLNQTLDKLRGKERAISTTMRNISGALNILTSSVERGTVAWNTYATSVTRARTELQQLRASLAQIRSLSGNINVNGGAGGPAGGGHGGGRNGSGQATQNPFSVFAPVLPSGMGVASAAIAGGYAVKQLVDTGRSMQAMQIKLETVSRSAAEFNNNLSYVKKTSNTLALDVEEFGKAYATIFETAKNKAPVQQIQQMTTGFYKFFKALQLTPDEQKGAMRAVGQMFNKDKIMAEEFTGQLGERATGVTNLMAKTLGVTTAQLFKMMQDGKLTTDMLFKLANSMGKVADDSKSFQAALKNSASEQQRFMNRLKEFADTIYKSGLDKILAKLFRGAVILLEILEPIVTNLIELIKTWVELIGVLKEVWANMTKTQVAVAGLSIGVGALVVTITGLLLGSTKVAGVLTLLQSGMRLLRRSLPIAGLLALLWVFDQIKDRNSGKANWVTAIGDNLVALGLILRNTLLDIKIFFAEVDLEASKLYDKFRKYTLRSHLETNPNDANYDSDPMVTHTITSRLITKAVMQAMTLFNKDEARASYQGASTGVSNNNTVILQVVDSNGNVKSQTTKPIGNNEVYKIELNDIGMKP